MDLEFSNPSGALWLLAACLTLAAGLWLALWRMRAAARFADRSLLPLIAPGLSLSRSVWRAILLGAASALIAVGLMDPRAGERTEEVVRQGADVMFVVDVSRSMLAEDATPSRLARAKAFISDAIDALGGDRVGLVDFAGVAAVRAPLTLNYDALKTAVDGLEPKDSRRGGSMLGDAIRLAMDSFTSEDAGRAIVVLSDGEDMGSDPVGAAREARDRGIRIITVGLGDARDGARVPIGDGQARRYLVHDGEEVWSRMDPQTLRDIADSADGIFVPAGTAQVELGEILTRSLDDLARTEGDAASVRITAPLYQWPAGLALALLVAEAALSAARRVPSPASTRSSTPADAGEARGRRRRPLTRSAPSAPSPGSGARMRAGAAVGALALVASLAAGPSARADGYAAAPPDSSAAPAARNSPGIGRGQIDRPAFRDAASRGAQALREGKFADAAAAYGAALAADPTSAEAAYNLGVASYRAGQHDAAANAFAEAAALGDARLAADAMFNQGNSAYQGALKALESPAQPDAAAGAPGTGGPGSGAAAPPDIGAAADAVERALTHYKDAIAANPADADARVNAELAYTLLKQLRQMQQQQEKEKEKQQQEQQKEKESKEQKEQQDKDQQQPKDQQEQSGKPDQPQECDGQQNPQGDPKDAGQPKDQPPRDRSAGEPKDQQQGNDGQQQQQQQQQKEKEEQQGQKQDDGSKGQDQENAPVPPERQKGPDEQAPPEGKVESQKDAPGKGKSPKDAKDGRGGRAIDPAPGAPMSKDEAERLLQAVRDRAKQRAESKERAERARQVPVPRDW